MPDRQKLIEELEWHTIGRSRRRGDKYVVTLELRFANSILDLLQSQPQIVRCGECEYSDPYRKPDEFNRYGVCNLHNHIIKSADWFCADGEPKGGEAE